MATAMDTPPKLTPEVARMRIGGMWQKRWTNDVSGLVVAETFLDQTRQKVLGVGTASERVKEVPPDKRVLHLSGLGKRALDTIRSIQGASDSTQDRLREMLGGFESESKKTLRTPKGDTNSMFAAAQIRDYVRSGASPVQRARELLDNLDGLRAVLSASPFASGLNPEQQANLLAEAERRHIPRAAQGREVVQRASEEIARSTLAAIEMVAEAGGLIRKGDGWAAPWEVEV